MKPVKMLLAAVCLLLPALAFAGGHSGCAHVHAGAYSHHSHHDTDDFAAMRTKICTGYIVYAGDTMHGIIVCAGNAVCIRASEAQDSTYSYSIKDNNLSAVMVQENRKIMYLARLENKKLYRVLHSGKLNIYDNYYSFDHNAKQFYDKDSWVKYDGHSEALSKFGTISVKRKLVSKVNEVYGLALEPKSYKKTNLLTYIDQLN